VPYAAEISRSNPTLLVFLIDRSTSMSMHLAEGPSKATFLADVINKTLATLITTCTKADGVRDYFHVSVVGYSGFDARYELGAVGQGDCVAISHLASTPLRVEERDRILSAEGEDRRTVKVKFPIWVEPISRGKTSMCAGLRRAKEIIGSWCGNHVNGYPPTLLHVTDGHPTDGDPEPLASEIRRFATEDGYALLFNLHVDIGSAVPAVFPSSEGALKDKYAQKLFRMSSELPGPLLQRARAMGYQVQQGARGFAFNATLQPIIDFFELGTRATTLR
jgi:hypothetical protein